MLQHRLMSLRRGSTFNFRNTVPRANRLFTPIRRKIAGKVKAKEIPKEDPIVDPFRAYNDPKYYSFLMNETPRAPWQEIADSWLYLKEGKWSIFDAFFASCIAIWATWKIGYEPWMLENFSWNAQQFREGRYYTALTSFASHSSGWHILANLLIAERCVRLMKGVCNFNLFFAVFMASGLIANGVSLLRQNREISRMGCSAGVCAMMACAIVYQPWRMMDVWIPFLGGVHKQFLWRIGLIFGSLDAAMLFYKDSHFGHDAHVTGYAVGVLGGILMKRFNTGVNVSHLWRKPVLKMKKKPPLWDTKVWDKLAQQGRRDGYG